MIARAKLVAARLLLVSALVLVVVLYAPTALSRGDK